MLLLRLCPAQVLLSPAERQVLQGCHWALMGLSHPIWQGQGISLPSPPTRPVPASGTCGYYLPLCSFATRKSHRFIFRVLPKASCSHVRACDGSARPQVGGGRWGAEPRSSPLLQGGDPDAASQDVGSGDAGSTTAHMCDSGEVVLFLTCPAPAHTECLKSQWG